MGDFAVLPGFICFNFGFLVTCESPTSESTWEIAAKRLGKITYASKLDEEPLVHLTEKVSNKLRASIFPITVFLGGNFG